MAPQRMFSKQLTRTDVKTSLVFPTKALLFLPDFGEENTMPIRLMLGTRIWTVGCAIRRGRYKKPVIRRGWKKVVTSNNFNVGDKITMYKEQEEDGSSLYRIEVQTPASNTVGEAPYRGGVEFDLNLAPPIED